MHLRQERKAVKKKKGGREIRKGRCKTKGDQEEGGSQTKDKVDVQEYRCSVSELARESGIYARRKVEE